MIHNSRFLKAVKIKWELVRAAHQCCFSNVIQVFVIRSCCTLIEGETRAHLILLGFIMEMKVKDLSSKSPKRESKTSVGLAS